MAGKNRKSGVVFGVIYIALLINVFIPFMVAIISMTSTGTGLVADVEYDKDPLVMHSVEIINRGDSYREYEADEYATLCEVIITYENTSWYASEYGEMPEFCGLYVSDGIEEKLSSVWLNSSSELVYEASGDHPIPAGKTGTRQYFIELWDGMTELVVREASDKLEGKCAEVVLSIPEGEWVSTKATVYAEE